MANAARPPHLVGVEIEPSPRFERSRPFACHFAFQSGLHVNLDGLFYYRSGGSGGQSRSDRTGWPACGS